MKILQSILIVNLIVSIFFIQSTFADENTFETHDKVQLDSFQNETPSSEQQPYHEANVTNFYNSEPIVANSRTTIDPKNIADIESEDPLEKEVDPHHDIYEPGDDDEEVISTISITEENSTSSSTLRQNDNVTIIVFGRAGVGISSTIRKLIGAVNSPLENSDKLVTLYEIQVPSNHNDNTSISPRFLRLVDVAGVVDGRSVEQDASVLVTLKAFLQSQPENSPSVFVFVSRFDDNRYDGEASGYVQMIQRGVLVYKDIFKKFESKKALLLFTRLMSETKVEQRLPGKKLQLFKNSLNRQTNGTFPLEVEAVVGENKGEEYGLQVENDGSVKLPSRVPKEYYPFNVFDKFRNITRKNDELTSEQLVQRFTEIWNTPKEVFVRPFNFCPEPQEVQRFIFKIIRIGKESAEENEINDALQLAYDGILAGAVKTRLADPLLKLQKHFQNRNITKKGKIPTAVYKQVRLLHNLPIVVDSDVANLLDNALGIKIPPFVKSPVVGFGYDVMKDVLVDKSPFANATRMDSWIPTPMMYRMPSFLSCKKLQDTSSSIRVYSYFANTTTDSFKQRLEALHFQEKSSLNASIFEGQLRLGYNVRPGHDDIPSLSVVKEFRKYNIKLNDDVPISDKFKSSVGDLEPFDSSVRDSEKTWKQFFDVWGTHVVSSAYAGGFIQGTVLGQGVHPIVTNNTELIPVVIDGLLNFTLTNASEGGATFYSSEGGDVDKQSKLGIIHTLPPNRKPKLMKNWIDSLRYDPTVLSYELNLIPIYKVVRTVNPAMEAETRRALELFLKGELNYKRVFRSRSNSSQHTTTRRPSIQSPTISQTNRPVENKPTTSTESPRVLVEKSSENILAAPTFPIPNIMERNIIQGNSTDVNPQMLQHLIDSWAKSNTMKLEAVESFIKNRKEERTLEKQQRQQELQQQRELLQKQEAERDALATRLAKEESERNAFEAEQKRDDIWQKYETDRIEDARKRNESLAKAQKELDDMNNILRETIIRNREEEDRQRKCNNRSWLISLFSSC